MELKNISPINYENENYDNRGAKDKPANKHTPNNVWYMRCRKPTPTDFRQKILTKYYGEDFIDKASKVLEIGFGCGRNAQFFMNETKHIQYYGFDTSKVSLKYFKKQGFPEDRHYVSLDVDDTILSQEYDLIFSTFVFQHMGFKIKKEFYDSVSLTKKLFPTLKEGGYWVSCEQERGGNNGWNCGAWYNRSFDKDEAQLLFRCPYALKGSTSGLEHNLYIIRKIESVK